MKPKAYRPIHIGPAHLLHRLRIQHQQIALTPNSVQHDLQQVTRVVLMTIRISNEDWFPCCLSTDTPHNGRSLLRVELDETIQEGALPRGSHAVDIAMFPCPQ